MRINELLVDITGRDQDFGEWPYFFSLLGSPSLDRPWGWQLDGHHPNLNVVVVDGHVITSPTFMRCLDQTQAATATVRSSILTRDLPPERAHPINGRTVAGPFRDNIEMSHEGLRAAGAVYRGFVLDISTAVSDRTQESPRERPTASRASLRTHLQRRTTR